MILGNDILQIIQLIVTDMFDFTKYYIRRNDDISMKNNKY